MQPEIDPELHPFAPGVHTMRNANFPRYAEKPACNLTEPFMRPILPESRIHPAALSAVEQNHRSIVDEVSAAVERDAVVVVGMAQNPVVKRARKALKDAGVSFTYLEYGSYVSEWRKRNALKMWTGWPTFPMVFAGGFLIGGAKDTEALLANGTLQRIAANRSLAD